MKYTACQMEATGHPRVTLDYRTEIRNRNQDRRHVKEHVQ
jgi:hypothetical protein